MIYTDDELVILKLEQADYRTASAGKRLLTVNRVMKKFFELDGKNSDGMTEVEVAKMTSVSIRFSFLDNLIDDRL